MIDWDRTLNVGTLIIAVLYAGTWWLFARRKVDVAVACIFEGLAIGQLAVRAITGFFPGMAVGGHDPSYADADLFAVAAIAAIISLTGGAYRRAIGAANKT